MKKIVVIVMVALIAIGLGCAALSEIVTPVPIDKKAVAYAVGAGVIEPNDYDGYGNLWKAGRLAAAVKTAYEVNVLAVKQLSERNELDYEILNGVVERNLEIGKQRESALFDPVTGVVPLAMGMFGLGGGALIGLMRKRPGDWTPEEVETAINETGLTTTEKARQLAEVVKGVQQFLNAHKDDAIGKELLALLSKQSVETRVAVAEIKATA